MEELNFSLESQQRFDALCESEGWTWRGMAHAFYERFGIIDVEELIEALNQELDE